jgi:flagellar biosynthetic protein FlhB
MADEEDRTEAATARRLTRARAAGQAPLSREAGGLAVLAAAAVVLAAIMPAVMTVVMRDLLALMGGTERLAPLQGVAIAAHAIAWGAAPLVVAGVFAGCMAVLVQTGFLINLAALLPDLSRLDPRRGLQRLAGPSTLLDAGKAVLKMAFVTWAGWRVATRVVPMLREAMLWEPERLLRAMAREVGALLLAMLGAQAVLTGFDVMRARISHTKSLRMSRQEVQDEHKETDGDPKIKARIKALRRQRARQRMIQAVPKATVVVTNPTHYAVALAYRRGTGDAPRVVAKGVDAMAARIRAVAEEHRVPIVANPPLARALHQVELDEQIPAELYKPVAELIAYVWRLRARRPGAP